MGTVIHIEPEWWLTLKMLRRNMDYDLETENWVSYRLERETYYENMRRHFPGGDLAYAQ